MRKKIFITFILTLTSFQLYAKSKNELAEELLNIFNTKEVLEKSIKESMNNVSKENLPYQSIMREYMVKYMSWDNIKADFAQAYADNFSEEELGDIVKFYKSPVGQKWIQKDEQIKKEFGAIGVKKMNEHLQEFMAKVLEERKKQQDNTGAH